MAAAAEANPSQLIPYPLTNFPEFKKRIFYEKKHF